MQIGRNFEKKAGKQSKMGKSKQKRLAYKHKAPRVPENPGRSIGRTGAVSNADTVAFQRCFMLVVVNGSY